MSELVIILAAALISSILIILGLIFYFSKKFSTLAQDRAGENGLQFLNQNIQSLGHNVAQSMQNTTRAMNERLDNATRVIMAVNSELGQMREIGSDLKNIQGFLKSPKLRGNLGEQGLKELLTQALPAKYFNLQYSFRNGAVVDAIINLEAGKIPIDAKFPLENFHRMIQAELENERAAARRKFRDDFRRHVLAISRKYINPDEGTAEFAFMYIPAETIYFEVINNEADLFELAANEHVVLSSPSTFFYYLRTIMLGLEGKRITEISREILKALRTVKQQSRSLGDNISVLNRHLGNAGKSMSQVSDQYLKLANRINRIDLLDGEQLQRLDSDNEK
ncbi:MAG: DNA recombination protein RmuC [Patescibacteria group bacterium]